MIFLLCTFLISLALLAGIACKGGGGILQHPVSWICFSYLYYFIAAPLWLSWYHGGVYYGRSFAAASLYGELLGLISLLAIVLGIVLQQRFRFKAGSIGHLRIRGDYRRIGIAVYSAGILFYLVFLALSGVEFRLFSGGESSAALGLERGAGGFGYLYAGVNLLIPGLLLYVASSRAGRGTSFALLFVACIFYISIGFRFRILILLASFFMLVHAKAWVRLGWLRVLGAATAFFMIMGLLAQARSYRQGLDIARLEGFSFLDLVSRSFDEGVSVFATTSAVSEYISSDYTRFDFSPLAQVLAHPIPRLIWPNKPLPLYLDVIPSAVSTYGAEQFGAAMHATGEWMVIGGWFGVVVIGLLLGACISGWHRLSTRVESELLAVLAMVVGPFLFYALSRGYLAQVVQDFAFIAGPILVVHYSRYAKKRREV